MSTKNQQGEGTVLIPTERIENKIFLIRGKKVMIDADLADLYGVPVKRLNEQVKRNRKRFPDDFMFRLSKQEEESLRSQFATLKTGRGEHKKYLPLVFTEQGIAMLSSVLNSEQAIQVNIYIIRVFTRLRELLATHTELRKKIEEHDEQIKVIVNLVQKLLTPPEEPPKRRIGFSMEYNFMLYLLFVLTLLGGGAAGFFIPFDISCFTMVDL